MCKAIEIFCGTGGVGKTTIASSRALYLAGQNKKVLLITIDPSKRLKQILNISDDNAGEIQPVNTKIFYENGPSLKTQSANETFFDAVLMSPQKTLLKMATKNNTLKEFEENIIIKTLSRPYGGMNEIMALIEINDFYSQNIYDIIILDTPPGNHFIDFLQSAEKIHQFFDSSFIEVFNYLESEKNTAKAPGFFKSFVASSVKKLLSYLEQVTGTEFLSTFIAAIVAIYKNKASFLEGLAFQEVLKNPEQTAWYLVTSIEQQRYADTSNLQKQTLKHVSIESWIIVNKCLSKSLQGWDTGDDQALLQLKESIRTRESKLKKYAYASFKNVIEFPEIISSSPRYHCKELAENWEQYLKNKPLK